MLAEALKRTTLLMRTHLHADAPEALLLEALTNTVVVLTADTSVTGNYAGQCAVTTAAMLMARSGHRVFLDFPDAPLIGHQPPLKGSQLVASLTELGDDLIPGVTFGLGRPAHADVAITFGDGAAADATEKFWVSATDWRALISDSEDGTQWAADAWPIGALGAAALAAGEAFKAAMRKLRHHARSALFDDYYRRASFAVAVLAEDDTPQVRDLGDFDMISGGAIANCALYTLLRVPGATGIGRVMDDDRSALSNLNRNMLLRHSRLELLKVEDLASYGGGVELEGLELRYGADANQDPTLKASVMIGVDHIPSRWAVQRQQPGWIGVGATDLFTVQVSQHQPGGPCAGCAHPHAGDFNPNIPTVAFVSFWSGLLLAIEHLRERAGVRDGSPQLRNFCALVPETFDESTIGLMLNDNCPVGHQLAAAE